MISDDDIRSLKIKLSDFHIYKILDSWKEVYADQYPNAPHKFLEHYISFLLMGKPYGAIIDIAADQSPFIDNLFNMGYIFTGYVQDMTYPEGVLWISDSKCSIGSLAGSIPLPNGSVDIMTLHCSFEHFEGQEDINFIREVSRLLRAGGRAIILPFYTNEIYLETPPQPSPNMGFGRFYDVIAIKERILKNLRTLDIEILNIFLEDEFKFRALILNKKGAPFTDSP